MFIHCGTSTVIIVGVPHELYKNNTMEFCLFLGMKSATTSFLLLCIFFQMSLVKS